jgi:hypothetical protein
LGFWIIGAKQKILGGVKCKKYRAIGENLKKLGVHLHPLTYAQYHPRWMSTKQIEVQALHLWE